MIMSTIAYSIVAILLFSWQTTLAKPYAAHSPLNRVWLGRIGNNGNNHHWTIRGGNVDVATANHTNHTDGNITIADCHNETSMVSPFSSPQARIKAFVQRSIPTLPSLAGPKLVVASWHRQLNQIQANATTAFSQSLLQVQILLEILQQHSPILSAVIGTSALAVLSQVVLKPPGKGLALPTMYSLALLGSSAGFHLFLYFITVGYALGIAAPLSVALVMYNLQTPTLLPVASNLHTILTILWGLRLTVFLLWREFVNWPQLHAKVLEVNQMATLPAKLLCWLVYSCFYVALATPCWSRLATGVAGDTNKWGTLGYAGIALQFLGLTLESVADYQKSMYKAQEGQRNDWCHVGLWTFSTHPNYLGELLFWIGTYMGGVSSLTTSPWKLGLATVGLIFVMTILQSAVLSLDDKQVRKYGYNLDYVEFRKTHSVIGPFTLFSKR